MNDFLEVYDYYKPEQDCENAIEVFERFANDQSRRRVAGLSIFNKNRKKICLQSTFDFGQDQHSFGNHDDVYLEDYHRQRGYHDLDNLDDDLEEEEEEEEQQQSNSRIPTRTAGPDDDVSEEDDFWESDDSDVSEEDESDDNM